MVFVCVCTEISRIPQWELCHNASQTRFTAWRGSIQSCWTYVLTWIEWQQANFPSITRSSTSCRMSSIYCQMSTSWYVIEFEVLWLVYTRNDQQMDGQFPFSKIRICLLWISIWNNCIQISSLHVCLWREHCLFTCTAMFKIGLASRQKIIPYPSFHAIKKNE